VVRPADPGADDGPDHGPDQLDEPASPGSPGGNL